MRKQKFLTGILIAAMAISTMTANFSSVSAASANSVSNSKEVVSEHSRVVEKEKMPDVSIAASDELGKMQRAVDKNKMLRSSANSVTETFTGVLEAEGDTTYLMLTLAPGEIIQATLAGPNDASINYDILLYTVDDDGNLGTCVAGCGLDTYLNEYSNEETKSVEDALSYINTAESNQSYALFVLATSGYSDTEPFSLTVSIDEEGYYDDAEPNDNPFDAVSITTGQKVTGNNLNVSNDQDWYVWQVPSTIYGVSMNLSESSYAAEIYYAIGDGSMVLVKPSSGIYKLGSGYYYIRVYNASDSFVSSDYTLSFQPYGNTASKMTVAFNGDQGSSKVNYGAGSYYRAKSKISPTVTVLDSSGYPVVGQSVLLVWQSGSWSEDSGNFERRQTVTTDSSGKATFSLSLPPAMGSYSYVGGSAITFEHYYDIAAFGVYCGSLSSLQPMYHFAYSSYVG